MYKVVLSRAAEKDLDKIDKKNKPKIISTLLDLRDEPFMGKKLAGKFKECYSVRVWPYRIIYTVNKNKLIVLIIRIGHRGGVYK